MDRLRIEQMKLAVLAPLILTADIERVAVDRIGRKSARMLLLHFTRDDLQADAADARRRPGEILVDQFLLRPTASKICAPQ